MWADSRLIEVSSDIAYIITWGAGNLKAEVLGLKFLVLGLKAENKTLKSDYDNRLKKIEELLGTKAER